MPDEQKTPEDDFFMRIEQPAVFRRSLLETSKSTLVILKELYKIKEMREKKQAMLLALKKEMTDLKGLIARLDELTPKYSKQELIKKFPKVDFERKKKEAAREKIAEAQKSMKQKAAKVRDVPRKSDDADKITYSLAEVEKRMRGLGEAEPQPKPKSDSLTDSLASLKKKLSNL